MLDLREAERQMSENKKKREMRTDTKEIDRQRLERSRET